MNKFDGKLRIILGFPRQGKTSFALTLLPTPHLFVCPGPSNPKVRSYPWVPDTDAGLEIVEQGWYEDSEGIKRDISKVDFALYCLHGNPRLFEVLKSSKRAYCLDEVGNICKDWDLKEAFKCWYREIGWRDGGLEVWATTQRAIADIPPGAYTAAREIYWVGPCKSKRIQSLLYENTSLDLEEEEFNEKLRNLKKYNWANPNVSESVLKVLEY